MTLSDLDRVSPLETKNMLALMRVAARHHYLKKLTMSGHEAIAEDIALVAEQSDWASSQTYETEFLAFLKKAKPEQREIVWKMAARLVWIECYA